MMWGSGTGVMGGPTKKKERGACHVLIGGVQSAAV